MGTLLATLGHKIWSSSPIFKSAKIQCYQPAAPQRVHVWERSNPQVRGRLPRGLDSGSCWRVGAGPPPQRNTFCDSLAIRNTLQILLRSNIKKTAKIKDVRLPKPFQNPSKNPTKSMSQKTCDFSWICVRKMLRCTSADINFVLFFIVFFACRTPFLVLLSKCIFDLKNLPKTLPKQGPIPPKIDAENTLFFNIIFVTFWDRFWNPLGLQDPLRCWQRQAC